MSESILDSVKAELQKRVESCRERQKECTEANFHPDRRCWEAREAGLREAMTVLRTVAEISDEHELAGPHWMRSMGAEVSFSDRGYYTAIFVISSFEQKARVTLDLVIHQSCYENVEEKWIAEVHSYCEDGIHENGVGLTESDFRTRGEFMQLAKTLGVKLRNEDAQTNQNT